jgi:acyl dehydratase
MYFDDRRSEGLIAPPMLAVALTWPIASNIGDYLDLKDFPGEILMTQVHYTERLDFHRLVRPGDRLIINGTIAGILPHRAGTHCYIRYEAFDRENRPVFTELMGAIFRGVTCRGEGVALDLPEDPQGDWSAGPVWSQEIQVDPILPYVYDGCTDIVYALHTSPAFAVDVGLPGIILQGTCTLALAARELVNREAGGDPERLKILSCRFSGMVRPGTTISLELKSRAKEALFFEVMNQEGEKAVSKGYARIID